MNAMIGNALLLGGEGYQISRSVRLRSSASAYFNRTPAGAGNRRTWTWSGWVKRGTLGTTQSIFCAGTSSSVSPFETRLYLLSSDQLVIDINGNAVIGGRAITAAVFRDPSAWYHIVCYVDMAAIGQANKARLYVNGVLQTVTYTGFGTTDDSSVNNNVIHRIGSDSYALSSFEDGYLTEINFIDGQALTPASFGETNAVTGVWQPKKYAGTYGTNGFYLNFSDNSGVTATTIGKDYSGNGNNWTPNNISVTAGVTYDSMLDVPTQWADGGNGRGNYCVLNPLIISGLSGGATLSNGNLRVSGTNGVSNAYARGTMALSGKFYAEFFFDVVNATASIGVDAVTATSGALATSSTSVSYRSGGNKRVLGTESAYGASWVANDIIGVAVDTAANTVEFFKNGTSQGVITSSALFAQGDCVFAMAKDDLGSPTGYANFGQRPFAYTPPTGFKALNTLNLPEPTILKGNQYFDAVARSGTGATATVALGFQPDFIWSKCRSNAVDHLLFDSQRGLSNVLFSNLTLAEDTSNVYAVTTSSSGYGFGSNNGINGSGRTYVDWLWKEGATQGFDIVTYTGNGSNPRNIAHSLGVAPKLIIAKLRSLAGSIWTVMHQSANSGAGQNGYLGLNSTSAFSSDINAWGNTAPTSSVFTVGSYANTNGETVVAYLFSEVAGFSKFGSYTGNGSADGPFVFCGFRPKFVLVKRSDAGAENWQIMDTSRDTNNVAANILQPNLSNAESAFGSGGIDFLSNGFKLRTTSVSINTSGGTMIFAAFAEHPFKNALAR